MENRYKLPKNIQIKYFQDVEKISGFDQKKLASFLGIVPRSYRDWRRGKFAIPQHAIERIEKRFLVSFPTSKKSTLYIWKQSKISASRQGGFAVLRKYGGPGTPEGRSKGGKRGIQVLRERGLIPIPKPFFGPTVHSPELAEFIGILLGDGHIGKEQWSITLNAKADRKYAAFVYQLVQSLFHFKPAKYVRHDYNVVVIQGSGIRSIQYLTGLGLQIGNKVKLQVGVPEWIKNYSPYRIACLRGLIDTDGGIFNHSYRVNGKLYTYRKLSFVNRSMPLLRFTHETLLNLGFTPKMIDKVANKRVWLYNQNEVKQYLKRVGTHNQRLLINKGG